MHSLAFSEYNRAFQRHRILSERMSKSFPDIYESFKYIRNRSLQRAVFKCGVRWGWGVKKDSASHPSALSDSMDVIGTRDNHGFPVIETACRVGDLGSIPGSRRAVGGEHGYHSNILAWRIPYTEEPGGLQSIGSQ